MALKLIYRGNDRYYIVDPGSIVKERIDSCSALIMGTLTLTGGKSIIEVFYPFRGESGLPAAIYDCPRDLERKYNTELENIRLASLSPELKPYAINGLIV